MAKAKAKTKSATTVTLARELAEHMTGAGMRCSKTAAKDAVGFLFEQIVAHVKGGHPVRIKGFGTFRVRATKARTMKAFGKTVRVKAKKKFVFRPSSELKG
jgi:nucleoid DNA-binding protein